MSRKIRTFGIPGDLPSVAALGFSRFRPHTAKSLASRLDYLDDCVRYAVCPDSKGERHVENGRVSYDTIPLPKELEPDRQDLGTSVTECRRLLDTGDLEATRERLKVIDWLVEDMGRRTIEPDLRRERNAQKGRRLGGLNHKGTRTEQTKEVLKRLGLGANAAQVAKVLGMEESAVRKIRWRYCAEIRK